MKPRARKDALIGWVGTSLKVCVNAPPVDGKANDALISYLSRLIGVSRSSVTVDSGETSHRKLLRFSGIDQASALKAIDTALSQVSRDK